MRPQSDRIILLALALLLAFGAAIWLLLLGGSGAVPAVSRLPTWMGGAGGPAALEADPGFQVRSAALEKGGLTLSPVDLLLDDQGMTLIGTAFSRPGTERMAALRWRMDGSPDTDFGAGGLAEAEFSGGDQVARGGLVDARGMLLIHGHGADGPVRRNMVLARLDRRGQLDDGFDGDGRVAIRFGDGIQSAEAAVIDQGGRIVVAGFAEQEIADERYREMALARLLPDGSPDASFGDGGQRRERVALASHDQVLQDLLALPGSGLLAVGSSAPALGDAARSSVLAQWLTVGLLDASFGTRGQAAARSGSEILTAWVGADGSIWAAGRQGDGAGQAFVQRHLADGLIDPSFGDQGRLTLPAGTTEPVRQAWLFPAGQGPLWVTQQGRRLDILSLPSEGGLLAPSLLRQRIALDGEGQVALAWEQGWLYLAQAAAAEGAELTLRRYPLAVP